jgi:hypothetical protein
MPERRTSSAKLQENESGFQGWPSGRSKTRRSRLARAQARVDAPPALTAASAASARTFFASVRVRAERRLRGLLAPLTVDHFDRSLDEDAPRLEIDIAPTQPEQLAATHPRADEHRYRGAKLGASGGAKQISNGSDVERLHLLRLPPWRLDRVGRDCAQVIPSERPSASRLQTCRRRGGRCVPRCSSFACS